MCFAPKKIVTSTEAKEDIRLLYWITILSKKGLATPARGV